MLGWLKKYCLLCFAAVVVPALLLPGQPPFLTNARAAAPAKTAQITSDGYTLTTVFQADGVVWSFAFLSPQDLLATLRRGVLLHVNLTDGSARELPLPLHIAAVGQGGLMDVHVKNHGGKKYVYLTYSTGEDDAVTALARGEWNGDGIADMQTIFSADNMQGGGGRHFGSRLLFHDGHIYMTTGDRGERDYAQELSSHNGKILRLTMDGKPAANNPFSSTPHALAEIWSYGHRNPQGIDSDAAGNIYSAEFGPRGGDELNRILPGENYGWPIISYGREYWGPRIGDTHHPQMRQPLQHWTPSISPSGMVFYNGDKFPQWRGNLFIANLSSRHLRRAVLQDDTVVKEEALFQDIEERIRHVRNGPDGWLYFSTDSGKIIQISSR